MCCKDFQNDFHRIMDLLKLRIGIDNAILREIRSNELYTVGYFGYGEKESKVIIPIGRGVTGKCALEQKIIIINDLSKYKGEYIAGINNALSELCIPIIYSNKILGTLNIESIIKNNFSEDKVQIAYHISEMLSQILINPESNIGKNLAKTLELIEKNRSGILT